MFNWLFRTTKKNLKKYFKRIEPVDYPYLSRQTINILKKNPAWLEKWVQFRTTDWMTELEYPEYTAKEVQRFLAAN